MALEYYRCDQCGKLFHIPDKGTWCYRHGTKYFHTWRCLRAYEKENPLTRASVWEDYLRQS